MKTKQCYWCSNRIPLAQVGIACADCAAKFADRKARVTVTAVVGSAWYPDCDPFFSMAFNPKRYRKPLRKFNALLRSDVVDGWHNEDSEDTLTARLDSVRWSGLHCMEVEVTCDQYADFKAQGYCYLEVF